MAACHWAELIGCLSSFCLHLDVLFGLPVLCCSCLCHLSPPFPEMVAASLWGLPVIFQDVNSE